MSYYLVLILQTLVVEKVLHNGVGTGELLHGMFVNNSVVQPVEGGVGACRLFLVVHD